MAYSYLVEGERYAGYFSRQFADEQDAWDFLRPLPGQSIFLRYKPGRPDISAIRMADQGPLFTVVQQNFAGRLLSRSLQQFLGVLDWRELTMFTAGSWPISKGKIEFGTVTAEQIHYVLVIYVSEMSYSYAVEDEYYSGHFKRSFLRQSSAEKFVDERKGKDVTVRYRPDSPNISVLRREDKQGADVRFGPSPEKIA